MFFVYILYSDIANNFYVGITSNLEKRLLGHNSGNTKSTKPFAPWRIVYSEGFDSRHKARNREKYLKSSAGRRWRKENIEMGD